jgi:signal transduction protein with GAF and PtsI domain
MIPSSPLSPLNFSNIVSTIVYRPGLIWNPQLGPLLELLRNQTHADGAYLYRLRKTEAKLELLTWQGLQPTRIGRYEAEGRGFSPSHDPLHIESGAWRDARLERFPEFLQNRFEAAVSIALVDSGETTGLINVCRLNAAPFQPRETEFIAGLSTALGALLAGEQLADELASVQRKLADRKLLDRAKGILQSKFLWTEEKAYLEMRRTSRRKRVRMGEIARHVIAHAELPYHAGNAAYGD